MYGEKTEKSLTDLQKKNFTKQDIVVLYLTDGKKYSHLWDSP